MSATALVHVESEPAELVPYLAPSTVVAPAADRARAYAENAKAPATRRAYASDWLHFQEWCAAAGLSCLPAVPQTVAVYIAALADDHKPATISRRMAAISARHKACGLESPASMRHALYPLCGMESSARMERRRMRKRPCLWRVSGPWSTLCGRA
jgi:hypothetical protein